MNLPAFSDDQPLDGTTERHGSSSPTRLLVILIVGFFVILSVWAWQPAERFQHGDVHPAVGEAMQRFELAPLVGNETPATLDSLHGEVVLINFWGTWCGPCLMEFPHLVEINDRLKGEKGFRFIPVACGPGGVDIDEQALRAGTEAYLQKLETNLDVYSDPGAGARRSLMKVARLPGFGFPTTVLINREGTIQGLWEGYQPGAEEEMEEAIKELLKS
ncbi:MAG: TlpA family protein disulfide reductase [Planctomycetes bacterium]|nr:TlpA family protein disulfide reductase [Planctomycetota bacterium]